jgi:hypothetical protein
MEKLLFLSFKQNSATEPVLHQQILQFVGDDAYFTEIQLKSQLTPVYVLSICSVAH